ncbi:hypothetical protein Ancab_037431 [Ancistrocladus abbreviatus]
MDQHHHQHQQQQRSQFHNLSRYVTITDAIRPFSSFPDDSNFFPPPHRPHRHPPYHPPDHRPPPPPPPTQPFFLPISHPPTYDRRHLPSESAFPNPSHLHHHHNHPRRASIDDDRIGRQHHHHHPPSPRIPGRVLDDKDRRPIHLPEFDGPDLWNLLPPRVNRDAPLLKIGLNQGPNRNRTERMSPSFLDIDRFRHDHESHFEGRSRFRGESNGFLRDTREDAGLRERDHLNFLNRPHHIKPGEFEFNSGKDAFFLNLMPDEELPSRSIRDAGLVDENARRSQLLRDVPRSPPGKQDHGNQFPDRGKNRVLDSGRYGDWDRRGESQEFSDTPRKKSQKKSAFLRMQPGKSSFRNRIDTNSTKSKGKEPSEFTDHQRFSGEREASPVELDVSFKSNSLVAKAVAPLASVVVCSEKSAPKDILCEVGASVSKFDVLDESLPNEVDIGEHCGSDLSVSLREGAHSNEVGIANSSKEVAPLFSDGKSSEACSGKTNSLSTDNTSRESPNGETLVTKDAAGLLKASSPIVRKKRKVSLRLSNSELRKKDGAFVNISNPKNASPADSVSDGYAKHPGKKLSFAGKVSGPAQNSVIALTKEDNVNESPNVAVVEKIAGDSAYDRSAAVNNKRKRSKVKSLPEASPRLSTVDDSTVTLHRSVDEVPSILNADESVINIQNKGGSDHSTEDGTNKYQDIIPLLERNSCVNESSGAVILGGVRFKNDLSASDSSTIHEAKIVAGSCMTMMNTTLIHDSALVDVPDKMCLIDIDSTTNSICTQPCENQASLSSQTDIIEESLEAKFSGTDGAVPDLSTSEGFQTSFSHLNGDTYCQRAVVFLCSDASTSTESEKFMDTSGTSILDVTERQPCADAVTILSDVRVEGESLNASVSAPRDLSFLSGEDYVSNNDKKRKLGAVLEVSGLVIDDAYHGLIHGNATGSDCSAKGLDTGEEKIAVSELIYPTPASLSCIDEPGHLLENGVNDNCQGGKAPVTSNIDSDPIVASPTSKKRKSLSSQLGFSSATSSKLYEIPVPSGALVCSTELPAHYIEAVPQLGQELPPSNVDSVGKSGLPLLPIGVHPDESATCGMRSILRPVRASFDDGNPTPEPQNINSFSVKLSALDDVQFPCLSELGDSHKDNKSSSMGDPDGRNNTIDVEMKSRRTTYDVHPTYECGAMGRQSAQLSTPSELVAKELDRGHVGTEVECENNISLKDGLPSASECQIFCAETTHDDELTSNSRTIKTDSHVVCQETLCIVNPELHMSRSVLAVNNISEVKPLVADSKSNERSLVDEESALCVSNLLNKNNKMNVKSDNVAIGEWHAAKTVPLPSQNTKKAQPGPIVMSREMNKRKNHPNYVDPKALPALSSFVTPTPRTNSSTCIGKPRTWHRTDKAPASNFPLKYSLSSQRSLNRQDDAYIRKSKNSLIRNPAPVAVHDTHVVNASGHQLDPFEMDNARRASGSEGRPEFHDAPKFLGTNATPEVPRTPPLPYSNLSKFSVCSVGEHRSSLMLDTSAVAENEAAIKSDDTSRSYINPEASVDKTSEDQCVPNDGYILSSNTKRMVYIKPKSNQLIAASGSSEASVHNMDRAPPLSSDSYYKRSKNQLVRASSENHIQKAVVAPADSSNSEGQRNLKPYSGRGSAKGLSTKVAPRSSSKYSLVWTLCNTQSLAKGINSSRCQKVLPSLLPWKRTTYWRSFFQSSNLSNSSPLSIISRKLLSSRKRDVIYKRSGRGFSLQRSKVVSVAGFSLKWSKSIERNSKKANKAATLAVAAMESKKREKNGVSGIPGAKKQSHSSRKLAHSMKLRSGERIFRIGTFRYKMDQSGRTLQRISDEEPSSSATREPEIDGRKPYVPKRLLIGNDEYVRIGNGNQLIRDPKRRKRMLASEKVRWSLHTARMRLAKKRKYCQFFTRFGKCNKDEGKCPYIHDSSKIAVCTKFLNGLCSDPNCKLTHKVIPERMPDCSFFLQGLCSNESCPYRHVNVNPKAATCGNFLRGYCADGNECRKKHSYICPLFEATGSCPKESKCKLYHPRKAKCKRRKLSEEQKNARGRYFGSGLLSTEPETSISGKLIPQKNDDIFLQEGRFADYISLDMSDEEAEEDDESSEQATLYEVDCSRIQLDDLDELKPVRLLDKRLSQESSQAINTLNSD